MALLSHNHLDLFCMAWHDYRMMVQEKRWTLPQADDRLGRVHKTYRISNRCDCKQCCVNLPVSMQILRHRNDDTCAGHLITPCANCVLSDRDFELITTAALAISDMKCPHAERDWLWLLFLSATSPETYLDYRASYSRLLRQQPSMIEPVVVEWTLSHDFI